VKKKSIFSCFTERASRRKYTDESLTLEELSFLLYSTQGVRKKADDDRYHLRMAPSGGARQPYETYLGVNHVDGLKSGIYRYLPAEHKLELIREADDLKDKMAEYAFGQSFVGKCAVCFFWAVVPYRTEWRYGLEAKKDLLIEAGHICQNLYLAVEAIEAGTCSICAYDQEKVDKLLEIDGETEFVTYLSPVGKLEK
jgi:SagB-type dehydrogenase family enzyme